MDAVTGAIYRKRERMSRYIDVEPMRDYWSHEVNESIFCPNDVLDSIDSQPDADVEPVRHAHWINDDGKCICSCCKSMHLS